MWLQAWCSVKAKSQRWVEIQSATGAVERYIPEWRGGAPRDGGGPDKQIVTAIARLSVGDTVTVRWYNNDHVRIDGISRQA